MNVEKVEPNVSLCEGVNSSILFKEKENIVKASWPPLITQFLSLIDPHLQRKTFFLAFVKKQLSTKTLYSWHHAFEDFCVDVFNSIVKTLQINSYCRSLSVSSISFSSFVTILPFSSFNRLSCPSTFC